MEKHALWKSEKIPLFDPAIGQKEPSMTYYPCAGAKSCVVVFPGGGYAMKADEHEGSEYAKWLNSIGAAAFVVDYRVAPYRYPAPQLDAQRAVRLARSLSSTYGYAPDKIGVMGSSAGSHLAGSEALRYGTFGYETDEIDQINARPDFMILCYGVLTLGEFAHVGSRENLLGASPDPALVQQLSLPEAVAETAPPAFLWHTADDPAVPVENSLLMAMAMRAKKVECELHVFRTGPHGMGLADDNPDVAQWTGLCQTWMQEHNWI